MTAYDVYAEIRFRLEKTRPALVRAFETAVEVLGRCIHPTPETIRAAGELAFSSEFLYVPADRFIPLSISRNEFPLFTRLLHASVSTGFVFGEAFLKLYPPLRFPLSCIAPDFMLLLAALAGRGLASASAVTLCLSLPEPGVSVLLLRCLTAVAASAPGRLEETAGVLRERITSLPYPVFETLIVRGTGYTASGRIEAGLDFLTLRSREARALLGLPSAVLEDVSGVLRIYSSGLADRAVSVASGNASVWGITTPYTDGKTVYLPASIDLFDTTEKNESVYTVLSALQASLIARGTFSFETGGIDFLDELRQRYGTVLPEVTDTLRRQFRGRAKTVRERSTGEIEAIFEGERILPLLSTPHEKFFFMFPSPLLIRFLFTVIELVRNERYLSRRYPGLAGDFGLLNSLPLRHKPADTPATGPGRFGGLDTILEAFVAFMHEEGGDQARGSGGFEHGAGPETGDNVPSAGRSDSPGTGLNDFPLPEKLKAVFGDALRLVDRDEATVYDTAAAAFSIFNALYDGYPVIPYGRQRDFEPLLAKTGKGGIHPEIAFNASPELFAAVKRRPEFDDLETPKEQDIDLTSFGSRKGKSDRIRQALIQGSLRIYRYPEFDVTRAGYREKHCTLYETILPEGPEIWADGILKRYESVHKRLRKQFLLMQPEEVELTGRWYDGDEIHLGDAVDFSTDVLRGRTPDERIFRRKILNRRDVTAAILLDASSSTDSTVGGTRIIDIEKAALLLLGSALGNIGDRFAMFTFFSMGRHNVFYNIVKDFDEPWSAKTRMRAASIEANAANRDGCAVRHTARRLLECPGKTRLLFILSDGIPADSGYGSESGADTNSYALEDTRRALLECRTQGIVPFCITIDTRARDYIPHLYGNRHFTVLPDVTRLPEKLSSIYARITK